MANKDGFDFDALKALNLAKYLKEYCKPMQLKKAQSGILLVDYKLKGVKQACVFLPFKKMKEAEILFKQIKSTKEHELKKVALVHVQVTKTAIGFQVKKGGLTLEKIQLKATPFFNSNFKLEIEKAQEEAITKDDQTTAEEESKDAVTQTDSPKAEPTKKKKLTPARKEKIKKNVVEIRARLDKIKKALKIQ